jgi:hypothetical protein
LAAYEETAVADTPSCAQGGIGPCTTCDNTESA